MMKKTLILILTLFLLIFPALIYVPLSPASSPKKISIEATLIGSVDDYSLLPINVSKIVDKRIYVREVLTEGHLPLIINVSLPFDVSLNNKHVGKLLSHRISKTIGKTRDIDFTYWILVNETYTYQKPVYKKVNYTYNVSYVDNSTGQNISKTINGTKSVFVGYENVSDYRYVWKETKKLSKFKIKKQDFLVVDIQGNFKASLGRFAVDVVPSINISGYKKDFSKFAWWDTSWSYYKVCNINNNEYSGFYQMKLNVSYNGGGNVSCEGHCQSDFDDIRFVDVDNSTVLPYWKETYVDSSYAIFWVNVSSQAMSDGRILMYYGNPNASGVSDGDDTFLFFDDFDTSTLMVNGYTQGLTLNGDGTATLNGGHVHHDVWSDYQITENVISEAKLKIHYTNPSTSLIGITLSKGTELVGYHALLDERPAEADIQIRKDASGQNRLAQSDRTGDLDISKWYVLNFTYLTDGTLTATLFEFDTYTIFDTISATDTAYSTPFYIGIHAYDAGLFDWVRIRKYASPEPTWSGFGSEQTQGGWTNTPPSISNPYPSNGSTNVELQPTVSVQVNDSDGNQTEVWLYTNETGSWVLRNHTTFTNGNGTISYDYTGANQSLTKYWWKVSANDSIDNTTVVYHFTTASEPSNYTYTEDFEDDTVGSITLSPDNPSESWYNLADAAVGYTLDTTALDINTTVALGTKSLFIGTGTNPNREGISFNFTDASGNPASHAIDYINFSVYPTVDTDDHVINFFLASGSTKAIHIMFGAGGQRIQINKGGTWTELSSYSAHTWYNFSVSINWTTHKTGVVVNGIDYGWFDFRDATANSVNAFVIIGDDTTNLEAYVDNIEVVSPTQMYEEEANNPPSVSITSPTEGAIVSGTVTIQGTASDSDGTVQSVQVKIDDGAWQTATGTTSWSYSWDTTAYADGSHTIYARAYDGIDYSTVVNITVTTDNNNNLVSENGIFEYLNKPCAVYYKGTYNRTYITFIDNTGKIKIKYYDHDNDTFSSEYTVYDIGSSDDHAAPSMLINDTGHIIVFFTDGHNAPLYVSASSNSEDISSWQTPTLIHSGFCTYPKPWQDSSGVYHVTYRYWTSYPHRYVIHSWSSDLSTWNSETLIDFGDGYWVYQMQYQEVDNPDYIHVVATPKNDSLDKREKLYYMYTDDGGITWKDDSGTIISLPATTSTMSVIWNETNYLRQLDVYADSSHNVFVLATKDIKNDTTPSLHMIYKSSTWVNDTICSMGEYYQLALGKAYVTGACIDRQNPNVVYVSSNDTDNDMQVWIKSSSSWSKVRDITTDGMEWKIRPMPVYNRSDEMAVLWCNGTYSGYDSWNTYIKYSNAYILNTAPSVSNEYPTNGSTDVDLNPTCHITVSDADGDTMTVYWYENTTGSWVLRQTNSSIPSGSTVYWTFTQANQHGTKYYWKVAVDDGITNVTKIYHFTTRTQYTPTPPTGFTATANGRFQIDLSWTKGSNADKTVIVFKTTGYPTSVTDGTTIYNDTGTSYSHTGLTPGKTYYYVAWSWNNTDSVYSSSSATASATTTNNPPTLSNENPTNGSTDQELSLTWSISITDADGDSIDWSIECSNGQNNSGTNEAGGTKSLSISGLSYNTEYKVWVNVTDGYDWTREWYTFTTRNQYVPDTPSSFTATAVSSSQIDLSWTKGAKADTTYIERNTVPSWDRGEGTLIYNGTDTSYSDTGLNAGITYYYQAWSYNITDNAYSTSYASASNLTKPEPPVFLGVKKTDERHVLVNWTAGNGADRVIIKRKLDSYPSSIDDGFLVANISISISNITDVSFPSLGTYYYRAWSYTSIFGLHQYSDTGTDGNQTITITNTAPYASNPYPADGSTDVSLQPTCHVIIIDDENDSVDVFFYWKNGSHWELSQTNYSISPGTVYWTFTQANNYNTTYYWKVFVRDYYNNQSYNTYYFTTRSQYTPDPPTGFTATTVSATQIDLSWTKGTNADYTYIRYKQGANPPNNRSDGTFLYNGTGTSTSLDGLSFGTQYSFKAWSYNITDNVYSPDNSTASNTTSANNPPSISSPYPSNGSTGISVTPTCHIIINDPEDDNSTVYFYENTTGSWVLRQTNSSVSSGSTVYWNYAQASNYDTTYWWKVVAKDIYNNESSIIYHFTTAVNQPPVISNPNPTNNSEGLNISFTFSVDISDPEGDTFNWTIECNNGQSNSSNDDTNGTKTLELTGLSYGTIYKIWVNTTDGINRTGDSWTRRWYQFATVGGLTLYCYNESNPSQAINFDIQISNYEGTQVYTASGLSNGDTIPINQVPYGENTIILVSSNGYKPRIYYMDLYLVSNYNLTFYLPPETTPTTGNQTTQTLRVFTNAVTITNTTEDAAIPFTHTPESVIAVYIYNNSIAYWVEVPDDKYSYNNTHVTINHTVFDNNTTMAKVEYYYWYYENITESTPLFALQVINPYEQPVKNAKVLIKRYINTTDGYENVTSLLTDGYGKASAYLIPDTLYKVFINKTGYQQEIADWIPTTEEASTTHIFRLEFSFNISINQTIFMIINISVGWTSNTTFYIHYNDASNNTNSITFRVYSINGTLLYTHTVSNNSYNFTYNNANNTQTYLYQIEINNSLWSTNQTINGIIYPAGQEPLITTTSLEDLLERFLGFTPFINPSNGKSVNWVYAIVAVIGILILLSFGYYNAHIGLIGCGLWFNLAFILISGLTIILPGIGTLLVVMGILFAIGGAIK